MRSSEIPRAMEQHARVRAGGHAFAAVLVGPSALDAWGSRAKATGLVRLASESPEEAARAYLEDEVVRAKLRERIDTRVATARARIGVSPAWNTRERTAFERDLDAESSGDALLCAGDLDGHLLVGYLLCARPITSSLRSFAAALRVLAAHAPAILLAPSAGALDGAIRVAVGLVEATPLAAVGVATTSEAWNEWQHRPGREHAKALLRAYVSSIETPRVDPPAAPETKAPTTHEDDLARSAAERALYEALEADERSRGLFALNETIEQRFGSRALEIDLSCPALRIAIEIDGFFHFRDADAYRRDRRKDVVLQREGYLVIRVLAEDVMNQLDDVLSAIHDAIEFQRAKERKR